MEHEDDLLVRRLKELLTRWHTDAKGYHRQVANDDNPVPEDRIYTVAERGVLLGQAQGHHKCKSELEKILAPYIGKQIGNISNQNME